MSPIYQVVPVVLYEDEIIHTDDHWFCPDMNCGCHFDMDLFSEEVLGPIMAGTLTEEKAMQRFRGDYSN
jgi:hypothetical protein